MWSINNPDIMHYTGVFKVTDAIEITILAVAFYIFLSWLSKTKYTFLSGYFHTYSLMFFGSYFFNLHAVNKILIAFTPVVFTLLVIFHQKSLQKNFVGFKVKKKYAPTKTGWLDTTVQVCLSLASKNQPIRCIIERKDPLDNFLKSDFTFNAEINKPLLNLILENNTIDTKKLIWLSENGTLKAINTKWDVPMQEEWFAKEHDYENEEKWFEQAQIFTEQTDAMVFSITPEKRMFNFVIEGKHISDITAYNFLKFVKMYGFKQTSDKKGRFGNAIINEKDISEQVAP